MWPTFFRVKKWMLSIIQQNTFFHQGNATRAGKGEGGLRVVSPLSPERPPPSFQKLGGGITGYFLSLVRPCPCADSPRMVRSRGSTGAGGPRRRLRLLPEEVGDRVDDWSSICNDTKVWSEHTFLIRGLSQNFPSFCDGKEHVHRRNDKFGQSLLGVQCFNAMLKE